MNSTDECIQIRETAENLCETSMLEYFLEATIVLIIMMIKAGDRLPIFVVYSVIKRIFLLYFE